MGHQSHRLSEILQTGTWPIDHRGQNGTRWFALGSGHPRRKAECARRGSRLSRHFSTSRRVSLHPADCRWSGRTGQVGTELRTGRVASGRDGIGTGSKRVGPEAGGMENGWDGIESRGTEVGTGLIRRDGTTCMSRVRPVLKRLPDGGLGRNLNWDWIRRVQRNRVNGIGRTWGRPVGWEVQFEA